MMYKCHKIYFTNLAGKKTMPANKEAFWAIFDDEVRVSSDNLTIDEIYILLDELEEPHTWYAYQQLVRRVPGVSTSSPKRFTRKYVHKKNKAQKVLEKLLSGII